MQRQAFYCNFVKAAPFLSIIRKTNSKIIMKNYLTSIIITLLAFIPNVIFANTSSAQAVSMASYEQSWLDPRGTIALKNNTDEYIHNVSFELEYLDMQGSPMDYETFTRNIEIAPGKTKKLDIPAYEHRRSYNYYKSEGTYRGTPFKIKYKLAGYNAQAPEEEETNGTPLLLEDTDSNRGGFRGMGALIMLILLFFGFGIYAGMYVLVAVMAKKRNRNPVIWLLLSFIATPLLICLILLVIGADERDEIWEK